MATQIKWAPREKRRNVYSAVGRNFLKTLTEPITNSDSILKKQAGVPHAAGLVRELLTLKVNDRLNSAELRKRILKTDLRRIKVEIVTAGPNARLCRVIDTGSGMTRDELEEKFGTYASAKAKGENTRSLFGRGALDVLLHHEDATIFSVKAGVLSKCRIYWDEERGGEPMCDARIVGPASKKLLISNSLPTELLQHGTVVEFKLKDGTHIPVEEQIVSKISSFYMLRLISADPNTEVIVERIRSDGRHADSLRYDFPLGTVVERADDMLNLGKLGKLKVSILLAKSDVALATDAMSAERRENGLLFVDDNDAVLDLTLLPEYDKSPYLKHMFGIVKVSGFREVLEGKLDAEDPEAVLTPTRDGFDRKSEVTQQLFALVERYVKPIFEKEEKLQKKGDAKRSDALNHRVSEALRAINDFNADETDEEGDADDDEKRDDPIYFSVASLRLYAGMPKKIHLYLDRAKVKDGEIVLIESDRVEIKAEPDSVAAKTKGKPSHQKIPVTLLCDVKGLKGSVTALTLDKEGNEIRATVKILGVDDPPVFVPPDDIAFTASRYLGDPNRSNNALLLVNVEAFSRLPEIAVALEEVEGNVSLGEGRQHLTVKVADADVMEGGKLARIVIGFQATGWGHHAVLRAKARRADGGVAEARCRLKFERPEGDSKFSNFHYEYLDQPVMGDVAGDKIFVNAAYALHREIFGDTEDDFNRKLESDPIAQLRAASVLVDATVFHTATSKYVQGGKKGLHIERDDPIGSLRPYLEQSRIKLEPKVYKALVK